MESKTALQDLVRDWARAEESANTEQLQKLLADDFSGIGPKGFVLDKSQWVHRFSGGFQYEKLDVSDMDLKVHDHTAIVVARQDQKASYQGHPSNGAFRMSQTWLERDGQWRLANLQLSTIDANIPNQRPSES